MKAEQIHQTRVHFPDLDGLLTDTVDTNTAMRRTNTHLGYRPPTKSTAARWTC